MTDFWLYLKLGLEHVLDLGGYDHILFLVALSATYSFDSWKKLLIMVTLFTVGHTLSLVLAHYGVVALNGDYVEFLIPITIMIAAIFNLANAKTGHSPAGSFVLWFITLFFGIVHGLGFARYYSMISDDEGVVPLLEFALGVELAQVIVVMITLVLALVAWQFLKVNRRDWVLIVSAMVLGMAIPMLVDTWPF
jgi:hypothetical protein